MSCTEQDLPYSPVAAFVNCLGWAIPHGDGHVEHMVIFSEFLISIF